MGVISTDPNVRLNATFTPNPPLAGSIGFMSQSGGLGLAIMDYAGALGLGLSTFVSVGNKSDISGKQSHRVLGTGSANEPDSSLPRVVW